MVVFIAAILFVLGGLHILCQGSCSLLNWSSSELEHISYFKSRGLFSISIANSNQRWMDWLCWLAEWSWRDPRFRKNKIMALLFTTIFMSRPLRSYPLSICAWFLENWLKKNRVGWTGIFVLNLAGYTGSKNPVQMRQKSSSSNLIWTDT